ncbi:glycoside hydrolase N-terminal domain-containing protein [Luteolibacter sp. LG18]|uniref:glycoside hydrolase N-terminal domain-containing protein n=1 Tax=Luteolibacter sp. LG18 TaxID=2819286 RepID=UPI002B3227C3|nr:hypothetical protein llg_15290 [Luteolibacter sp. LG18]
MVSPVRLLVFLSLAATAAAAPPMELWFQAPAREAKDALPVGNGKTAVLVSGDPKVERLVSSAGDFTLRIDWLDGDRPTTDYRRSLDLRDGLAVTTWKRGGSLITTTVLASRADDVVLVHLLAGMPGALGFRATLEGKGIASIGDRAELLLKDPSTPSAPVTRAWVLPFESEVEPDGNSMVIRGEGEAMIVLARAPEPAAGEAWKRLATRYGGPDEHPDLSKVWAGALAAHQVKHRSLMDRCTLDLGGHEAAAKPTDERVKAAAGTRSDQDLAALLFHDYLYRAQTLQGDPPARPDTADLLVSSRNDVIHLLPALPAAWKTGTAKGLPVAGGLTVDLEWQDGTLVRRAVHAPAPLKVRVNEGGRESEILAE